MILHLEAKDALTILAVFAGPVTALYVQRILDVSREEKNRKQAIFKTLWNTRAPATRLHYKHVDALNSIELEFAGNPPVINAWREYLDILNLNDANLNDDQRSRHWARRDDKFLDLVFAISRYLNYRLSRLEIQRVFYRPKAHETWVEQELAIREGAVKLFAGSPLNINVVAAGPDK